MQSSANNNSIGLRIIRRHQTARVEHDSKRKYSEICQNLAVPSKALSKKSLFAFSEVVRQRQSVMWVFSDIELLQDVVHGSIFTKLFKTLCGSVSEWLGRWTCDQQVVGSNPSLPAVECSNPRQVVNTHAPRLPSSIIWYQPMGSDASAGKVTVARASHWPRVTDISGSPPTGPRPRRGR